MSGYEDVFGEEAKTMRATWEQFHFLIIKDIVRILLCKAPDALCLAFIQLVGCLIKFHFPVVDISNIQKKITRCTRLQSLQISHE